MAVASTLRTPQIISLEGSILRVAHPDVARNLRAELVAEFSAGGTSLSVNDNHGFANDDFLLLGEPGDAQSEEVDINEANESGTGRIAQDGTITITNTTNFAHEIHTPVRKITERGIRIYGATSDGGAGTLLTSIDAITAATPPQLADALMIQWNRPYTEYLIPAGDNDAEGYTHFYVVFTDGTTNSSASGYVPLGGFVPTSTTSRVINLIDAALVEVNATVDGEVLTYPMLLSWVNDWQDAVKRYVTPDGIKKDWTFEMDTDDTSITLDENENEYALSGLTPDLKYTNSHEGILNVRIGSTKPLQYTDLDQMDKDFNGVIRGTLASPTVVGATTITLSSSIEFAESGSILVGPDTLTYTANAESTGVLSGIPASGAGSITAVTASGRAAWQGISAGLPTKYTIRNNRIVFNLPIDTDLEDYPVKMKYIADLARFTSVSDSVSVIPFDHAKYYIAARIEERKGNTASADRMQAMFERRLAQEAVKDGLPMLEAQSYYEFGGGVDGGIVGEQS